MLEKLADILSEEILAGLIGLLLGGLIAWAISGWRFFRAMQRLKAGDLKDQVLMQSHELLPHPEGAEVLCFTTELVFSSLSEILPNPALSKLYLEAARKTTEAQPLIRSTDEMAGKAIRDFVNHASAQIQHLDGEYLFLLTRESQDDVKRKLIRVFLIPPELLRRFLNWDNVMTYRVENDHHWPRLLNLHLIAREVLDASGALRDGFEDCCARIIFSDRFARANRVVDWQDYSATLRRLGLNATFKTVEE